MRILSRDAIAKGVFVVSLVVLAFGYGWVSRTEGWFPDAFLQRAWQQGERETERRSQPPDFTAPRVYRGGGIKITEAEAMQPGLTLLVSTFEAMGWKPGVVLFDGEGRVLHQWRVDPTAIFSEADYRRGSNLDEQDLHGVELLPDGDLVANVEYAGTVRIDACSDVEWTLTGGGHHSVEQAEDGTFWIPGVTRAVEPRSEAYPDGYPGLRGRVHHGLLVQVDGEAPEVLQSIDVLDVLYDNDLERYIPKYGQLGHSDVVHMNDIEPLPTALAEEYPLFEAGDLLVSLRNLHLVFVLDPVSHEVKWHASEHFIMQHDPDWIGDGWIGVFDNNKDHTRRGTMLGGSRVVAVQPHTDSIRILFPTARSEPFYTEHRGAWQRLANGNLLLTESSAGRVVEVAPDGRTVWEWIAAPYSDSRVPSVGRAERLDLTAEEVARWPCSRASRVLDEPGG